MTLYARDVIVGDRPNVMFRNYNSLDMKEVKGERFDLIIIDELLVFTIKSRIRVLQTLWELWKAYPQTDWLVTGTPISGGVEIPFSTEVRIPQPLKVFSDLTRHLGEAWHIPSDDDSLIKLMPEERYREEILAEFLE